MGEEEFEQGGKTEIEGEKEETIRRTDEKEESRSTACVLLS